MTNNTTKKERRRYKRFKLKKLIIAADMQQPAVGGKMIDISWGGLAFQYLANGSRRAEDVELVLYKRGDGICMENVKAQTVSDIMITNQIPFSTTSMRRCSVKFGKLTHHQTDQLEQFFLNYTI